MPRRCISVSVLLALGAVTAARAGSSDRLDWSTWQQMPLFHNGRMMPINTFARLAVEAICGKANPRLSLDGALLQQGSQPPGFAQTRKLFPDGQSRRFTAAELLFSWLVEPQRWENVPFLIAEHEQLRQQVLGLPIQGKQGSRLKYVSPRQVENVPGFRTRLIELAQKQKQADAAVKEFSLSPMDKKLKQLYDAFTLYRLITFDPTAPDTTRRRFLEKLTDAIRTWKRLEPDLKSLRDSETTGKLGGLVTAADDSVQKLIVMIQRRDVPLSGVEPLVVTFRQSASGLAEQFAEYEARLFQSAAADLPPAQLTELRARMHALATATAELARQADEAHLALYDNGHSLRLVPGLNPAALRANRDPDDDAQPWVNLQTLLWGSEEVLRGYPRSRIQRVRETFRQVADVYVSRGQPERTKRFAAAMDRFAAAVRQLGEGIEPIRRNLPIRERDEELIALTAYPPVGYTRTEVHYYQLDPFFWSWVISLASMACFALAFGVVRKPMFWLGMLVLAAAQFFNVYGLGLRVYITGRAPVTNMFETVVFVALTVAVLGLSFTVQPLLWPGLGNAWRLTAIPFIGQPTELSSEQTSLAGRGFLRAARHVLLLARLALAVLVLLKLAWFPYSSDSARPFISLLPRTPVGSMYPTGNELLVWVTGLCLLGISVWLIPRLLLTVLVGLVTVPYSLAKQGLSEPLEEVLGRKWFAVSGASVGFLAAYVAYFAPIFDKDINPLMPVLRSNFWLTSHVLSIVASYGAGALGWGLGMIALGYYLFGRYRDPSQQMSRTTSNVGGLADDSHPPQARAFTRQPPAICDTLGHFIYKAVQVAVLLLVVGTILGGLWADVSWGRFWGWDPKEVWALITLLIYLALLHGRSAGWFGNLGLAIGSVLGATSILMAWYGVNYVLRSGLHYYGEGVGGVGYVLAVVALNWGFVGIASIRYLFQTRSPVGPAAAMPPGSPTPETQRTAEV